MRHQVLRSLSIALLVAGLGTAISPLPSAVQGRTIGVTSLADDGPGSLRQALTTSRDGDRVEFAVEGRILLESTLNIARSVTVAGPEVGEGQAPSIRLDGQNMVPVLHVAKGAAVTLERVAIERGWTDKGGTGAGITNEGRVTLHRCLVHRNEAGSGGGVFNRGQLEVLNSQIRDNRAAHYGGGIFNGQQAQVRISRSVVAHNHASQYDGGGISSRLYGSSVELVESRMEGNFAESTGGAIAGSAQIIDSTIIDNEAGVSGGGIAVYEAQVIRSAIIGNRAADSGGGVRAERDVVIANTTVAANTASRPEAGRTLFGSGGGIAALGRVKIINSTIAGNRAGVGLGGGIAVGSEITPPEVKNTILDDNAGGNCNRRILLDLGHNLQHPSTDCGDSIPSGDPRLAPLDLEHPSPALVPAPDSPAIDAGDRHACGSEPVSGVDQRGMARPTGGQAGCDTGAVEAGAMHTPTPGYTPVAAATEPPDLVPDEMAGHRSWDPETCPELHTHGTFVQVWNRGGSAAGRFVVEFGGIRKEVDHLAAGSSASLHFPESWGRWLIADVEDSVAEWFEENNVVENVLVLVPTRDPRTTPTVWPSATPAPTPVVTGQVTFEITDDPRSCAQPLAVRASFTATSSLSRVTGMRVRLDSNMGCCTAKRRVEEIAWQAFDPVQEYEIDGGPVVFLASHAVQFRDDEGHLSPVVCQTLVRHCEPHATRTPTPDRLLWLPRLARSSSP